jgi:hypothetical protein
MGARSGLQTWTVGELTGADPADDPEDGSASAAARDADTEGILLAVAIARAASAAGEDVLIAVNCAYFWGIDRSIIFSRRGRRGFDRYGRVSSALINC